MQCLVIGCLLIVAMVTFGCATTRSTKDLNQLSKKEIAVYNANPQNTDKIVCTREKPVGSNIPVRECYKESKIKERQFQDQQAMKEFLKKTPPVPSRDP